MRFGDSISLVASKLDQLKAVLRSGGRTLVAYSGGVDSVLLAKVAHDALGGDALAVIADSPSLPRRELEEALEIGKQFGFPVRVIKTNEMADANYTSNPSNRCYFCKSELFEKLWRRRGVNVGRRLSMARTPVTRAIFGRAPWRPGNTGCARH